MSLQITQEMRDANTHAHLKAIADAQHKRNAELHEMRVASSPWLQKARAIQKMLNESEAQ